MNILDFAINYPDEETCRKKFKELRDQMSSMYQNSKVINTLFYYDVVNFARKITVPGFYSWGFNDETTPPTSFYSAFNVIKVPKRVHIIPEGKHKIYPEQVDKTYARVLETLGKNNICQGKNYPDGFIPSDRVSL